MAAARINVMNVSALCVPDQMPSSDCAGDGPDGEGPEATCARKSPNGVRAKVNASNARNGNWVFRCVSVRQDSQF